MNDGKIVVRFIKGGSFVSKAIAFLTNSYFSHVEFGTPEGTWIGAHAGDGVQERAANYCNPVRDYRYEISCTSAQQAHLLEWARSFVGKTKYNYLDIIGLLIHCRKLNSPDRDICDQFVFLGLNVIFPGRVMNVLPKFAYLLTPETLHLSPLFVGCLKYRKG